MASSTDLFPETAAPPKKRGPGRPPKSESPQEATSVVRDQPHAGGSTAPGGETDGAVSPPLSESEPKRRRGRPRKTETTQTTGQADGKAEVVGKSAELIVDARPSGMLALIDRAIRDPENVPIPQLREILAFQKDLMAHQAEIEYHQAKARVKNALANIKIYKRKSVEYDVDRRDPKQGKYEAFKYAPLEEIDKHLAPILAREEFDPSFTSEMLPAGGIMMTLTLRHVAGHAEKFSMPLPFDETGGKTAAQARGSTTSYGRRYLLCMAFNIVVLGEDDDGTGGFVSEEEIAQIRAKVAEIVTLDPTKDEAALCKFAKVDALEQLPNWKLDRVLLKLDDTLKGLKLEAEAAQER